MRQGWKIKKLGDCLSYVKNGANIKQIQGASGIPITRIETLSGGVFNRDRMGYADITNADKYLKYILQEGDILMSHINSKQYIGRAVLYNHIDNEVIIHGMNLLCLKTFSNIALPEYMNIYFKSFHFKEQVARIRKDAVNQSSMSITDLCNIIVPVPPLPAQQKIVEELDCLSKMIELKKKQLETYDKLAQAIFCDMFGDPITNEKGWEMYKWDDVLRIVNGKNQSKVEAISGEYPIYGSGGAMGRANSYLCPENTIILGRKGNINKPIYVKEKLWNVDTAFGLVANEHIIHSIYLYFYCIIYDFMQHNKAVTIPSLTKSDLLKIQIPIPPLSLQQQFAEKIEAIEKQKSLIKKSLEEVETLFNSRMDYYFN